VAKIEIRNLWKVFSTDGSEITALKNINLDISDSSFVTIVGKSGCGKTTLLRILSGLEKSSEGDIRFLSKSGESIKTKISVVFQEPRLMPWLTVKENIRFSLLKENDSIEVNRKVDSYLEILDLHKYKDLYPSQISGGMAQRVALGRTLCYEPDIVLMDEPLGALDIYNRRRLQDEIKEIQKSLKKTIIFVTHDIDEALYLGEKVLVISNGQIVNDLYLSEELKEDFKGKNMQLIKSQVEDSILGRGFFRE
jgi:sulfonate transport system ATP-binding protein